jgi:4-amino-4-deoxy-L-arabinose transferase-like glycosyltransferase
MENKIGKSPTTRFQNLAAAGIILFFIVLSVFSVRGLSLTADEPNHYKYGTRILSLNSTRFDDSKMPITALNVLPAKLASKLPTGPIQAFVEQFIIARSVTILFSAMIALLVFHWSRSLYGFAGGLATLVLYVLDPNIIAHSQLVTTDMYVTGMVTFSCYWLWKYAKTGRFRDGFISALVLGFSQITKYTAIVLIPLFLIMLAAHDWSVLSQTQQKQTGFVIGRVVRKICLYGVIAIASSIVLVNIGFLFNHSFTAFKDYRFVSQTFKSLQSEAGIFGNIPVPVPYPYLQGLDEISFRESTGFGYGKIYLLGQLRQGEGFKGYYFAASLFKVPIATQLVLIGSLVLYFINSQRRKSFFINEIFLLLPVLFFTIYFNFFYNAQIGIRFYLIIFPLLYVLSGGLFQTWDQFSTASKSVVLLLALYLAASVLSYYPQYLAYFNELVPDRKTAYKYLSDSNLNWGQGKYYLEAYLTEHPEAIYEPEKIVSGEIIASPDDLVGVTDDPQKFAWLRENFEPTGTVAYAYLIYEVSPQALEQLCQTKSICP